MNIADYAARRAIAELSDQLRAARVTDRIDAHDALRRDIIDLRRRCAALEAENVALKSISTTAPSEPLAPRQRSGGRTTDELLTHLAGQLDAQATFGNALKARLEWGVTLAKIIHEWTRDVLQPFNRSVDNRLRYLEMVVEETVLASSPDLQRKLARIRHIVGAADLSAREMPSPPASDQDASSNLS
jgi:hypothetical protein